MLSSKSMPISSHAAANALRWAFSHAAREPSPLVGTFFRHILKRDNFHLCGAGNAARLHIAVQHDRVITRARQQLHLGFKQTEQPGIGAFFAAKNVVQNFIGAVAVVKTDIVYSSAEN